jgi:NAD(P)-dependent dehydrogenase (short-subunit alcohol dehydrogenase family)
MKKVAIVTGASGNLGQAVVNKFISENYTVCGTTHDGKHPDASHAEYFTVDLTNETNASGFITEVTKKHNHIDVGVLTVGGFAMGAIEKTSIKDIYKQYQLNFETTYNVARPLFLHMMQSGSGRIFVTGSKPGLDMQNAKGMIAYALAKSLVFRLAELMNIEAKGKDVFTTVIVPTTIDTPENRKSMPKADFSKWSTPESIAEKIWKSCSENEKILEV